MCHVIYNLQHLNLDIYSPSSVCPSVEAPHAAPAVCTVHSVLCTGHYAKELGA